MTMKLALLLLPVHSEPTPNDNGFDAPAKKRKRSHSKTRARRSCNGMSSAEFDNHCRSLAREEIVKTLKLAEAIERGE